MKKLIAWILLVMVVLSAAGCTGSANPSVPSQSEPSNSAGIGGEIGKEVGLDNHYTAFPKKLTAEKVNTIDREGIVAAAGGIYYKDESGKYGIMTAAGQKDTGAIYAYVESVRQYFIVAETKPTDINTPAALNCMGLVDANGKEIIPQKYALIELLNETFAKVYEVTERTDNDDDALIYYTDKFFSMGPDDDEAMFKGTWYVYNVTTGQKLEYVSGTKPYSSYAYGECLRYTTDAGERIVVTAQGKQCPDGASPLGGKYYALIENVEGAVYDTSGNKLFSYEPDGYRPLEYVGEYFIAELNYEKFVLWNKSGETVCGEFYERPELYGNLIFADNKLYTLNGNIVIEGLYSDVYRDEVTGCAWLLESTEGDAAFITENGDVLVQVADGAANISEHGFYKSTDNGYLYYSFADLDYTISGGALTNWLIQTFQPDNTRSIVDALSGATIISGYETYRYTVIKGSGVWIYAQKSDGTTDVYAVA